MRRDDIMYCSGLVVGLGTMLIAHCLGTLPVRTAAIVAVLTPLGLFISARI